MASKAKPLREEVKKRFHPLLEQRGFVKEKPQSPYFTTYRRVRDDVADLIDIQWDKYWRPYFVVNFSQGKPEDENFLHLGRLQRKRGAPMFCWFNIKRPWLNKLKTGKWYYAPEEVVDELIDAYEELEEWFRSKRAGPHVHTTDKVEDIG